MRRLARVRAAFDVPNLDVDNSGDDPDPDDGGTDFKFCRFNVFVATNVKYNKTIQLDWIDSCINKKFK